MNSTIYTSEVMNQAGRIYDRLEHLPPDKRALVKVMAETFISGMIAQERLSAAEKDVTA